MDCICRDDLTSRIISTFTLHPQSSCSACRPFCIGWPYPRQILCFSSLSTAACAGYSAHQQGLLLVKQPTGSLSHDICLNMLIGRPARVAVHQAVDCQFKPEYVPQISRLPVQATRQTNKGCCTSNGPSLISTSTSAERSATDGWISRGSLCARGTAWTAMIRAKCTTSTSGTTALLSQVGSCEENFRATASPAFPPRHTRDKRGQADVI